MNRESMGPVSWSSNERLNVVNQSFYDVARKPIPLYEVLVVICQSTVRPVIINSLFLSSSPPQNQQRRHFCMRTNNLRLHISRRRFKPNFSPD